MTETNLERVLRVYEDLTTGTELSPDLFHPDCEFDATEVSPDVGQVIRGVDATLRVLQGYWEMFEGFTIDVEEVVHVDDRHVVVAVRDGGRLKRGGAEVWSYFFNVWTLVDGKIVRQSVHTERERALAAISRSSSDTA